MTSKLNNSSTGPTTRAAPSTGTLEALGFDHVDLFLIHWPLPTLYDGDFVSTWKALEEFKADGRARSIGVSNFQVEHLERLAAETDTVPAVNQIELHPYFQNREVRAYDEEHGIATEAWSPLAQGEVLDDPAIGEIAERVGRTPAQVVLRWHIQRGNIVFPKSVDPRADQGELRALRLRARATATSSGSTNSTGARAAETAPTPIGSTTRARRPRGRSYSTSCGGISAACASVSASPRLRAPARCSGLAPSFTSSATIAAPRTSIGVASRSRDASASSASASARTSARCGCGLMSSARPCGPRRRPPPARWRAPCGRRASGAARREGRAG